jgi:hypothetical protein
LEFHLNKYVPIIALTGGVALGLLMLIKPVSATVPLPKLYFHIKHVASGYPNTLGKVQQIYDSIQSVNKTGYGIGLEPQCIADWNTQLSYLSECANIPVMLNVLTSDDSYQLSIDQITQAMAVCPVRYFRFHEVCSYYQPLPVDYIKSILSFARGVNVPIFWNEWDVNTYNTIASVIQGYEDIVAVSFGTNSGYYEPAVGFQFLQRFQRRAASVQSWYWWERNGRLPGYEYNMPPELMVQFTQEAFQAGCEIVQYEPFDYFFSNEVPKSTLAAVLA